MSFKNNLFADQNQQRAVIFDLDNTLIDVDPIFSALVERIAAFIQDRSNIDLLGGMKDLLKRQPWLSMYRLLENALSSSIPQRGTILREALNYYETTPFKFQKDFAITLLPGARELIEYLRGKDYLVALVTKGDIERQKAKINRIHPELFDIIEIAEDKKKTFQEIIRKHRIDISASYAIGDKKDLEIKAANQLGLKTIHFAFGRHKNKPIQNTIETPAHTVYNMQELLMFFKRLHHEF